MQSSLMKFILDWLIQRSIQRSIQGNCRSKFSPTVSKSLTELTHLSRCLIVVGWRSIVPVLLYTPSHFHWTLLAAWWQARARLTWLLELDRGWRSIGEEERAPPPTWPLQEKKGNLFLQQIAPPFLFNFF